MPCYMGMEQRGSVVTSLRLPSAWVIPGSTPPWMPTVVRPHVTPDTTKTMALANVRGKEDDVGSLLASSKGSCPRLRGSVAALVPPHGHLYSGDDASTAFDMVGSRPQCTANATTFLNG